MPRQRIQVSLLSFLLLVLLVCSGLGLCCRWDPWYESASWRSEESTGLFVRFSPSGDQLLTGGSEGALLWDAHTGEVLRRMTGHSKEVFSGRFSSDGKRLVTVSDDLARLWDAESGELVANLKGHSNGFLSIAISPDSSTILTGGWDGRACLWDAESGQELAILDHGGSVDISSFSHDGRHILTAGHDGTAKLWTTDGSLVSQLEGHSDSVYSGVFGPTDDIVATRSMDKTIRLWSASSGDCLCTLQGVANQTAPPLFFANGNRICVLSGPDVLVFDTGSGAAIRTLQGHARFITHAQLFSEEDRLVTGSKDGAVKVWSVSTGRCLAVVQNHAPMVIGFSIFRDRISVLHGDGTIRNHQRRHPEYWWGIMCLGEFWAMIASTLGVIWSLRRDVLSRKDIYRAEALYSHHSESAFKPSS